MKKYKFIFWDMDGTLANTYEGVTNCVKYAMEPYGIHLEGEEELRKFIGPPLRFSFTTYCGLSEEEAEKAQASARALFSNGGAAADMPSTVLCDADFTDGRISVIDMLIKSKLAASRSEARRLIEQGGVFCGDEKVTTPADTVSKDKFEGDGLIVKKGKKTYHKFTV